jgi:hypothetical protein
MYGVFLRIHVLPKAPATDQFDYESDKCRDCEPDYLPAIATGGEICLAFSAHE